MPGEEKGKIRILLADGHHLVRQGIRRILEEEPDFRVVGEVDNGQDAVRLAREVRPDIIVMEARISKLDSVEITRRVKVEHPAARILILTASEDEEYIVALVGAGASGYMLKSTEGQELAQAIRFVRAGEFVSDPIVTQKLFKRATRRPIVVGPGEHLTRRELEVLRLAAKGMSNQDIGDELGVGLRTVKGHIEAIFGKTGARSRTEAVLMALKEGWVSLQDE